MRSRAVSVPGVLWGAGLALILAFPGRPAIAAERCTKPAAGSKAPPRLQIQAGHSDSIQTIAFDERGELVATGSYDATARLWDARTGQLLEVIKHRFPVLSVSFLRGTALLATADGDGGVRLTDTQTGRTVGAFDALHGGMTYLVASPDGSAFATGCAPVPQYSNIVPSRAPESPERHHYVQIWDGRSAKLRAEIPIRSFSSARFSEDGRLLAIAARDTSGVALFDARTGTEVRRVSLSEAVELVGADARWLYVDGSSGLKRVEWQGERVEALGKAMAWACDGSLLQGREGGFRVVRPSGGGFEDSLKRMVRGAFSADGRRLAVIEQRGNRQTLSSWLRLYDEAGRLLRVTRANPGFVTALAFSPDGTRLVTGSDRGAFRLWDAATGRASHRSVGRAVTVHSVEYSPDGRLLAVADSSGGVTLWSADSGAQLARLEGHEDAVWDVGFSPDGRLLASTGGDATVRLWEVASRRQLRVLKPSDGAAVQVGFSQGGKVVEAYGEKGRADAWDGASGEPVRVQGVPQRFQALRMIRSAKNQRMLVVGRNPEASLGKIRLRGHTDYVEHGAFSPDGRTVATASRDSTVRLWDTGTGRALAVLRGHGGWAQHVSFSPDGRILASSGDDGTVILWNVARRTPAVYLIPLSDGEWMATTPKGAYLASPEATAYIGWSFQAPLEVFGFEQLAPSQRRPDLVKRRLAGGLQDLARVHRPPHVRFLAGGAPPPTAPSAAVAVGVCAQGRRPVRLVRAYVEGRLVAEKRARARAVAVTLRVPLLPGTNRVQVVAVDKAGYTSNPAFGDVRTETAGAKPDLWVVAVGVNRYPRMGSDLSVAVADARSLAEVLEGQVGPLYGSIRLKSVLLDEEASPEAIRAAAARLSEMRPDDVAVLFFAGHGVRDPQTGDMAFVTSTFDGKDLGTGSVRWAEIGAALARAQGRVVVLVDACHAGSLAPDLVGPSGHVAAALRANERAGALVFAAAKGRQESLEVGTQSRARGIRLVLRQVEEPVGLPIGHGVFTSALIDGLRGDADDLDGNGSIELSELISYVRSRVEEATQGRQQPWVARRELFGDFRVAKPRARSPVAAAPGRVLILRQMDGPEVLRASPGERLLVGRHPEARFLLSDPRVARRHAYLEHVNGAWTVRDAGSFQGTYVNERRVEEAQLRAGDVVRMGVSFKVELE